MQAKIVGNAHLIAGSSSAIAPLLSLLEKQGIDIHGNPDVYVREYKSFGVDEARGVRERSALRPTQGERRIFIIAASSITAEAQNALLKTLEEPHADAWFFIITPAPDALLATVRSRTQRLELDTEVSIGIVDAKKFLSAAPAKRLDMLKPLLEKDDDDKRDLGAILNFLAALERALKSEPEGLHAVYRARKYVADRGALVKPLLEQVALLVPHV